MQDEILKLAEQYTYGKSFTYAGEVIEYMFYSEGIEAFYRAAYNAGIEAACKPVRDRMIGYAVDDSDLKRLEQDIKALEMK